MNKKSKMIIGLLAVAAVLFCTIEFWIIPSNQAKQEAYAQNQTDALTHDISVVQEYKTPYVGNATKVTGLFHVLPLQDVSMNFEIDSKACILTVNYLDTVRNIGEEKVRRDVVYNSVAAMAAIDNLSGITYHFYDSSYSFTREQIEVIYGASLSDLLDENNWRENVQDKVSDKEFVGQFFA